MGTHTTEARKILDELKQYSCADIRLNESNESLRLESVSAFPSRAG